ncbi:MAG: hypothetical protein IKE58_03400 [Blautia sp.]|nr:hypothetical protein [Blautia sp.]
MKRRRTVVLLLAVMGFAGMTSSPSRASLIVKEDVDNRIIIPEVNIHIEEDYVPPVSPDPGDRFRKCPQVVNDSVITCYIRARIFSLQGFFGFYGTGDLWTYQDDGWWYYRKPLSPGEATQPLFEEVEISNEIFKENWGKLFPLDIGIYAEATGNADKSLKEAWDIMDGESI